MVRKRNNRINITKMRKFSFLRKMSLHFVDSICEMGHLGVQLGNQTFQSINAIENFDALRMRIVPDLERSTHGSYLREKPRLVTKLVYSKKLQSTEEN